MTAPQLEKAHNELPSDTTDIILDMNSLEYISSAGLRVLLSAQKKMNKIGTMKLTDVCDVVMEVFEMTGCRYPHNRIIKAMNKVPCFS